MSEPRLELWLGRAPVPGGEWADSRFKNAHGKEKAAGKCPWVLKTDQGRGAAGKPRFWRSALAGQGSPGQGGGQGGMGLS